MNKLLPTKRLAKKKRRKSFMSVFINFAYFNSELGVDVDNLVVDYARNIAAFVCCNV